MPAIEFGISSYERGRGDLPELPVINMFAEEAPTEGTGIVLQSRPGLSDRAADMGNGPIEALFKRNGVLSGALFGVSGGSIYSGTTALGIIAGSGPVSIAGNEVGILATAGETARYYNGTALSSVSFPDGANVRKVFSGASRFWLIRDGSGKLYFTPPLAATVAALDFVTAESLPDDLLDGIWLDDGAILGGAESVEFWPNTGDDDLPIQPLEGMVIEEGLKATGCLVNFGPTFAWVSNKNQVRLGKEWEVISNPGLEAQIASSTEVRLFSFILEGNEFLALRLDEETHVWGLRARAWSRFASYGRDNWIPQCFAAGVFGSSVDGKTLEWGAAHLDLGGVLERRFRGGFPINSGGMIVGNVQIRCNVGQTPFLSGDYTNPTLELRLSRDAGQTWGSWKGVSLGEQGNYRTRVQWRALGMASQPGFLAEFRTTAPVPLRVSEALMNEQWGGR
jgi:hypothetical protein